MKAALRPALPLLIGIALAGVLALVAMHSLTFGTSAVTHGSHHSAGYSAVSGHSHGGADAALAVLDGGAAHAAQESADATHGHAGQDHAGQDHVDATHEHAGQDHAGQDHVDATHEHAGQDHVDATHEPGASAACASPGDAECCSSVANASGAPTIAVNAFPGSTLSALAASVSVASLLATEAAERPPSRALLSVIRV